MKKICLLIIFLLLNGISFGQSYSKDIKVKGYYRKDGSYVPPHYRTKANSTINDNYSTKGNINPYTLKPGWIDVNYEITSSSTLSSPSTITDGKNKFKFKDKSYLVIGIIKSNGIVDSSLTYLNRYLKYQDANIYLLNGEVAYYNKKNKLLFKGNYNKGIKNGDFIYYDLNGDTISIINFKNNDCKKYTEYSDSTITIISNYSFEIFETGTKFTTINRKTKFIKSYQKWGTLTIFEMYFDKNKPFIEFTINEKMEYTGTFKKYDYSSRLEIDGFFIDGCRTGDWLYITYNPNDVIIIKYEPFYKHNSDSIVIEKGSYAIFGNGAKKKHGYWRYYNNSGELLKIENYHIDTLKETLYKEEMEMVY